MWLLRAGLGYDAPSVCFDVVLPPSGAVENCYSSRELEKESHINMHGFIMLQLLQYFKRIAFS